MSKQRAVQAARKRRKIEAQPNQFLPEGSSTELLDIEVDELLHSANEEQNVENGKPNASEDSVSVLDHSSRNPPHPSHLSRKLSLKFSNSVQLVMV